MKGKIFILFIFLTGMWNGLQADSVTAYSKEQLQSMLRQGGPARTEAVRYIHRNRTEPLIRGTLGLLKTGSEEDQRAVIRSLREYGTELETYIPDWYTVIDLYMTEQVPPDILLECIDLAGFWKEHRLIPALSRMAVHPSTEIRNAAFRVTARFQNDAVIPSVLRLLNSVRPVERIYGLEAALAVDDPRIHPFVIRLLDDSDTTVQIYAVRTVASMAKNDHLQNLAVRLYRPESHPDVRETVIRTISDQGWRKFASIVVKGVSDPSAKVRAAAIETIAGFGDTRGALNISAQLMHETDPELKFLGLNALVRLDRSGGGDGIAYLIRNEHDPRIRIRAVAAARILNDKNTVKPVTEALLDDPSSAVRLEAAYSLGSMLDRNTAAALLTAIKNDKELIEIRSAAMVSYVNAEGRKSAPDLLAIISADQSSMLYRQWEAVPGS